MQWTKAYGGCWFTSNDCSNWDNRWGYHPCGGDILTARESAVCESTPSRSCCSLLDWVQERSQTHRQSSLKPSKDGQRQEPHQPDQFTSSLFPHQCPRKIPSPVSLCMNMALNSTYLFPCIKTTSVCRATPCALIRKPHLVSHIISKS